MQKNFYPVFGIICLYLVFGAACHREETRVLNPMESGVWAEKMVIKPLDDPLKPEKEYFKTDETLDMYFLKQRKKEKFEPANMIFGESFAMTDSIYPVKEKNKYGALYHIEFLATETFPQRKVLEIIATGKTPIITIQMDDNISIADLEKRAIEASMIQVPIFLVCGAKDTMSSKAFVKVFRDMQQIFKEKVKNIAFVWEAKGKDMDSFSYYPGDMYVDWVSFTVHETIEDMSLEATSPYSSYIEDLEKIYTHFEYRKPMMIFYGVSHYAEKNNRYYIQEATQAFQACMDIIKERPYIKGVVFNMAEADDWFTMYADAGLIENYENYVEKIKTDDTFLETDDGMLEEFSKSIFQTYRLDGNLYISKEALLEEFSLDNDFLENKLVEEGIDYTIINLKKTLALHEVNDIFPFDFLEKSSKHAVYFWWSET